MEHGNTAAAIGFSIVLFSLSASADPVIIAEEPRGVEGGSAVFTFRLSEPGDAPVTFNYASENGSAVSGADFTPIAGTVRFELGETFQQLDVPLIADGVSEPKETFALTISEVKGAAFQGSWTPAGVIQRQRKAGAEYYRPLLAVVDEGMILEGSPQAISTGAVAWSPGAVEVFRLTGSAWLPDEVIMPPESDWPSAEIFGFAMDYDAGLLVVGDPEFKVDSQQSNRSGAVYIFRKSNVGTDWDLLQRIDSPLVNEDDFGREFGYSVSISENRLLVGRPGSGAMDNGAFLYEVNADGNWEATRAFAPDNPDVRGFGSSVFLGQDTVIIGANARRQGETGVFIYQMDGDDNFALVQELKNTNDEIDVFYALAIAFDGMTLAVGAPADDIDDAGSVELYQRSVPESPRWSLVSTVFPPDSLATRQKRFGSRIAISGDTLISGDQGYSIGTERSAGAAFVYRRSAADGIWRFQAKLDTGPPIDDENTGVAIGIAPGIALVGKEAIEQFSLPGETLLFTNATRVTATIADLEAPVITVDSPEVIESANSLDLRARFTIGLSEESEQPVEVGYRTVQGTALADIDYESVEGAALFDPGETEKVIEVKIVRDPLPENAEVFQLELTVASKGTLARSTGECRILDTDRSLPQLTSSGAVIQEGDVGASGRTVTLQLSEPAPAPLAITFRTLGQTATSGTDFVQIDGSQAVIAQGESVIGVPVEVIGDTESELNEHFDLIVDAGSGVQVDGAWGESNYIDKVDGAALVGAKLGQSISISGGIMAVGRADRIPASRTRRGSVKLFRQQAGTWIFDQSVAPAAPGDSYSFGQSVALDGDMLAVSAIRNDGLPVVFLFHQNQDENGWEQEHMISAPEGAIEDGFGSVLGLSKGVLAVASPNDAHPELVSQKQAGAVYLFQHTLAGSWLQVAVVGEPIDVFSNTENHHFGTDLVIDRGALAVAGNSRSNTFLFSQDLGGPDNWGHRLMLPFGFALAIHGEVLAISTHRSIQTYEKHRGGDNAWGLIQTVAPSWTAAEDDERGVGKVALGKDALAFVEVSGRNSFRVRALHVHRRNHGGGWWPAGVALPSTQSAGDGQPGSMGLAVGSKSVVAGFPDNDTAATDAGGLYFMEKNHFPVIIQEDEKRPLIGFTETRKLGNEGSERVNLGIALEHNVINKEILIDYETLSGTATAGEDFFQVFGQLRVDAGANIIGFDIGLIDDSIMEPEEEFQVAITAVSDGAILLERALVTVVIQQEDGFGVEISDAQIVEGNDGTRDAVFKVARFGNVVGNAPISYSTLPGTATVADNDYTPVFGTLRLTAEQPEAEIRVPVIGDRNVEPDETFTVTLFDSTNAGVYIEEPEAIGTIITDDQLTFVSEASVVRLLVPTQATPETWRDPGFDDSTWLVGPNAVGYDTAENGDYLDLIKWDVGDELASRLSSETSVFLRYPFSAEAPDSYSALSFRIKYDDGFVAYLNGERVLSRNASFSPRWDSKAMGQHDDLDAVLFESFDLTEDLPLIRAGNNVLAIHGQNASSTSSDFLIIAELLYSSAINGGFEEWLAAYPGIPESRSGMQDDPDRDTLSNLMELGLGTSPTRVDPHPLVLTRTSDAGIQLEFKVLETPSIALKFELQRSVDATLESWQSIAVRPPGSTQWSGDVQVESLAVPDGALQRVLIDVRAADSREPGGAYLRLLVTDAP